MFFLNPWFTLFSMKEFSSDIKRESMTLVLGSIKVNIKWENISDVCSVVTFVITASFPSFCNCKRFYLLKGKIPWHDCWNLWVEMQKCYKTHLLKEKMFPYEVAQPLIE